MTYAQSRKANLRRMYAPMMVGAQGDPDRSGAAALPALAVGVAVNTAIIGASIYAGRRFFHTSSILGDALAGSIGYLTLAVISAAAKPA